MIEFAYAATSGAANPSGGGMSILMIVLMVAIFYFMLIRPESKRKKQAEEMRSSLQKGDWLTTIGGVYGRIVAITDRTVVIETSEDRVRIEFLKSAIGSVGTLDEQAAAAQRGGGAVRRGVLHRPPHGRVPLGAGRPHQRRCPAVPAPDRLPAPVLPVPPPGAQRRCRRRLCRCPCRGPLRPHGAHR